MTYSNLVDPFGTRDYGSLPPVEQVVRQTIERDLGWIKVMADAHRAELGFVMRSALAQSHAKGELLALAGGGGFCRYHLRRDGWYVIYEVVSTVRGGGRAFLSHLGRPLRLKCPQGLPANEFYEHMGGTLAEMEPGRTRPLNVWEWH